MSSSTTTNKKLLLKIIILGDSGVGKTSLMQQYVTKKFDNRYKATIGADFLTKPIEIDGKPVTLQIWDTAGQERFQSLGSAFYRGADACVLTFDITQQDSFSHLTSWLEEFVIQAGRKEFVLIGNKADLAEKRAVFQRGALAWCQKNGESEDKPIPYFETSAKDNTNVEEAFLAVAQAALQKKVEIEEEVALPTNIKLQDRNEKPAKKKGCC